MFPAHRCTAAFAGRIAAPHAATPLGRIVSMNPLNCNTAAYIACRPPTAGGARLPTCMVRFPYMRFSVYTADNRLCACHCTSRQAWPSSLPARWLHAAHPHSWHAAMHQRCSPPRMPKLLTPPAAPAPCACRPHHPRQAGHARDYQLQEQHPAANQELHP